MPLISLSFLDVYVENPPILFGKKGGLPMMLMFVVDSFLNKDQINALLNGEASYINIMLDGFTHPS